MHTYGILSLWHILTSNVVKHIIRMGIFNGIGFYNFLEGFFETILIAASSIDGVCESHHIKDWE